MKYYFIHFGSVIGKCCKIWVLFIVDEWFLAVAWLTNTVQSFVDKW